MIPRAPAILAICSVLFSGCGTFSDALCGPVDDHVFYRGVRFDLAAVAEGGWHTLLVADIPLSAVADTLAISAGAATAIPFSAYAVFTGMSLEPIQPDQPPAEHVNSIALPAPFPTVTPPLQK